MPSRTIHPILAADVLVALWISMQPAPVAEPSASGVMLEWIGPPACVDTGSIPQRVEHMLGAQTPPPMHVRLRAEPGDDSWDLTLEVDTDTTTITRTLRGRDCETLTEAVALIVAVHVDPLSVAVHVEATRTGASDSGLPHPDVDPEVVVPRPPAGAPGRDPPSRASPSIAPSSAPGRASRREPARPRGIMGASVAAELGVLPKAAAAFEISAGLRWPRAQVELAGLASLGPDASAPQIDTVEGRFRLYTGIARGCGVLGRAPFEVPLCGALELGDLHGRGLRPGLEQPASVHALWVAMSLGVRPRWVLHPRVALGLLADLIAPLRRHRFAVPNAGTVHEVAPIGARLGLGLQVRLP